MLKSLLSNKEKLLELGKYTLNENCSALSLEVTLRENTRRPLGIFSFHVAGIARDVFVSVGKFTFPADFVIVDYESDPRVPLILGRPFLRTARALIDVHGEEMILRDGDERLILNMRHDTSSYSNKPKKESINMIDIYNVSHKDYLEDLFANEKITNHQSGNPTFSSHTDLTSPEVINPLKWLIPTSISESWTKESVDDPETVTHQVLSFLPECDSVFYEDIFPRVDYFDFKNHDNEDKVFNPGILIHENHFEVTNCVKNVKKLSSSNASLILEDFNPPLYELPFHKEIPGSEILLLFSSENEEKVFNPGILTSKRVHTSLLPELSHRDTKAFKVIKIFESPMEIFPCSYGEDIHVLDVPCLHFLPP
ncbi:reverse transcriptase domain-containing protein [Tanacetum coccineum]